jgi:hypothetical protein
LDYADKADNIRDHIELNNDLIASQTTSADWMHIISSSIIDFGMEMQANFHETVGDGNELYHQTDYLKEMQKVFGGNNKLTWDHLGAYSGYLEGFSKAINESM